MLIKFVLIFERSDFNNERLLGDFYIHLFDTPDVLYIIEYIEMLEVLSTNI